MALSRLQTWARDEITAITALLTTLDSLRAGKYESDTLGYQGLLQASDLPVPGPTPEQLFAAIMALDGLQTVATAVPQGQTLSTMAMVYLCKE